MQDEEFPDEVMTEPDPKRVKHTVTMTTRDLPLHAFPRDTFCIACMYQPQDQKSTELQNALTQLNARLITSQMGHDFKILAVQKYYATTLRALMPEDTEEWSDISIENHMNGLHGNSSLSDINKLDLVFKPKLMKLLEGAMMKINPETGETELNPVVVALRLKLSATLATMR